jgi:hypothetical protein
MDAKFTAGHNRNDRAGDCHRSATFDTADNTVGSRFDKVPCTDGTTGSSARLGVVQVIVVTGVKYLEHVVVESHISNEQGPSGQQAGDAPGRA